MSFRSNFISRKLNNLLRSKNISKLDSSSLDFNSNSSENALAKYKVSVEELSARRNLVKHMYSLYDKYLTTYFPYYKRSVLDELENIREVFPTVNYFVEFRIKSRNGYQKKVLKKLDEGHTGKIYDLYGSKIVIESYYDENGNLVTDEDKLTEKALEISSFLEQKMEFDTKKGICQTETVHSKDYIHSPKPSGYMSYHVLRHLTFSDDISFYSETQVKTRKMYDDEQFGEKFGHESVYKNNRKSILENSTDLVDDVPVFLQLYWNNKTHQEDLRALPFNRCFEKFFRVNYKDYKEQIKKQGVSFPSLDN